MIDKGMLITYTYVLNEVRSDRRHYAIVKIIEGLQTTGKAMLVALFRWKTFSTRIEYYLFYRFKP